MQNLQRSYGYFVDKSMWDEVTELFADDATLEIGGRGVFVGKKRVNEYMHFLAKQGPQTRLAVRAFAVAAAYRRFS